MSPPEQSGGSLPLIGRLFAGAAGALLTFVGLMGVKVYVWDAVIGTIGAPDRSAIFWLIPIFLMGIGAAAMGVLLLRWALRGRTGNESRPPIQPVP